MLHLDWLFGGSKHGASPSSSMKRIEMILSCFLMRRRRVIRSWQILQRDVWRIDPDPPISVSLSPVSSTSLRRLKSYLNFQERGWKGFRWSGISREDKFERHQRTITLSHCAACSKEAPHDQPFLQCGRCRTVAYCYQDCQKSHWPTHKDSCKRPNYIIYAQLGPDIESFSWTLRATVQDPPAERTLSCPAHATFDELHHALQTAFGWATTHTYDFALLDPIYRTEGMNQSRSDSLQDMIARTMGQISPNSPREYILRISDRTSRAIDKSHESQRKHPRTEERSSASTKLCQIFDMQQCKDGTTVYEYDFGDRWAHLLTVTGREPATNRFKCIDGVGHPVAEDVRQDGWGPLKAAYRAENPTDDQRHNMRWYKQQASNGDPQGLGNGREHVWNQAAVSAALSVRVVR